MRSLLQNDKTAFLTNHRHSSHHADYDIPDVIQRQLLRKEERILFQNANAIANNHHDDSLAVKNAIKTINQLIFQLDLYFD